MTQLFLSVLSLSLSGTLVGFVILLTHPLTQRFFSKRWNYYIWLLVAARLLIPVHIGFHIALPIQNSGKQPSLQTTDANETTNLQATSIPPQQITTVTPPQTLLLDTSYPKTENKTDTVIPLEDNTYSGNAHSAEATQQILLMLAATIAGIIWLLGAVVSLFRKLQNYHRFVFYIKKDSIPATDTQIQLLADESAQKLRLSQTPVVYNSPLVYSPITIGLWKPAIILPQDLDTAKLPLILQHELIHIARRDLWYKWFYQILLCIHWFNPILHLIGRTINIDCELSCDEAVLAHMDLTDENKKAYGNLLLDTAQRNVFPSNQIHKKIAKGTAFSTTLLERKRDLKKRLNGIIHYKKTTPLRLLLSICAFTSVLLLTACSDVNFSLTKTLDNYFTEMGNYFTEMDSYFTEMDSSFSYNDDITQLYDDDQRIAEEDIQDRWVAFSYLSDGNNKIEASSFLFSGSDTIKIIYASAKTDIKIDSSFGLYSGKFKIVHIAPDGLVTIVSDDTGKQTSQTISLQKGRNVIKMVGQKAKLRELKIQFSNLKNSSIDTIYNSEGQEYIGLIIEGIGNESIDNKDIDKDKILEVLPSIEAKEASKLFKMLLDRQISFEKNELVDLLIFSDKKLSSSYLAEAVQNGTITLPDADTVSDLMPFLTDDYKAALLIAVPASDFSDAFLDCLPFLQNEGKKQCSQYLAESIQNGTITPPSADTISGFMPYLNSTSRAMIIKALPTNEFFDTFVECLPYLDSSEIEECLLHYLDAGGTLTYTQFSDILPYLSQSTIRKIDNY